MITLTSLDRTGDKYSLPWTTQTINDQQLQPWTLTHDPTLWNYDVFKCMRLVNETYWFCPDWDFRDTDQLHAYKVFEQRYGVCRTIEYPYPMTEERVRQVLRTDTYGEERNVIPRRNNESSSEGRYTHEGPVMIWSPKVYAQWNDCMQMLMITQGDEHTYLDKVLTHCYHKPYKMHHNWKWTHRYPSDTTMYQRWKDSDMSYEKGVPQQSFHSIVENTNEPYDYEVYETDLDNGKSRNEEWNLYDDVTKANMLYRYQVTRYHTLHTDMAHFRTRDELNLNARREPTDAHQILRETHCEFISEMRNETIRIINHLKHFLKQNNNYNHAEVLQNNSFMSFLEDALSFGESPSGSFPKYMSLMREAAQMRLREKLFRQRMTTVDLLVRVWMANENHEHLFPFNHDEKQEMKSSIDNELFDPRECAPVIEKWLKRFMTDQCTYFHCQRRLAEHLERLGNNTYSSLFE